MKGYPPPPGPLLKKGGELRYCIKALEWRSLSPGPSGPPSPVLGRGKLPPSLTPLFKKGGELRYCVKALEWRSPSPGPIGPPSPALGRGRSPPPLNLLLKKRGGFKCFVKATEWRSPSPGPSGPPFPRETGRGDCLDSPPKFRPLFPSDGRVGWGNCHKTYCVCVSL